MCCPSVKAGGHECICASRLEALFYSEAKPLHSFRRLGSWPQAVGLFPLFFFFFFLHHVSFSISHRIGVFWPHAGRPFFAA